MNFTYVLTTDWAGYWKDGKTSYPIKFNKSQYPIQSRQEVILVKQRGYTQIEKIFTGHFELESITHDKIWFKITNCKELNNAPKFIPKKYFQIGIHDYENDISGISINNKHQSYSTATPIRRNHFKDIENATEEQLHSIFKKLMHSENFQEFEELVDKYLRIIGIPYLYKITRQDSRGKADGYFKLDNLFVLYDATLEKNIIQTKNQQLENYKNQLLKDNISIEKPNKILQTISIKNLKKEIWIINKDQDSIPYTHMENSQTITTRVVSLKFIQQKFENKIKNNLNLDEFEQSLILRLH